MLRSVPLLLLYYYFQQPTLELPNVTANPHTTGGDIEQGRQLYAGRCAGCHGPEGDGGKGANLAVPVLPRAASDLALYRVVRYGLPETEMPATLLAPREVWQIAAFVKTLGGGGAGKAGLTGADPARGAAVARSAQAGCLNCHAIGLDGGRLGPALSDIGARRGPGHLRAKLLDATAGIADSFRMVELTTRAGSRKVSGVRLNEDVYSIQLRDASGAIHSFWKRDLSSLRVERRTPMPGYQGKLSAQELDDLIAYLASLRGEATNTNQP